MKKLLLFTDGFPWTTSEIPFLYNELNALTQNFEVEIVARVKADINSDELSIDIPQNVILHKYVIRDLRGKDKFLAMFRVIFSLSFYEELIKIFKSGFDKDVFREMFVYWTTSGVFRDWMKRELDLNSYDICYTYWNSYATLALSFLKGKNNKYKLISRMHRYDLYNERTIYRRQYFKEYVDRKLDRIFFIAEHGRKYYLEHFANSKSDDKYLLEMIGVKEAGNLPVKENNCITMVSCSNVIAVKRVNLIVEALADIDDIDIKWIHLGGGIQFDDLNRLCKEKLDNKNNISYELKGKLSNVDVRKFYDNNYVDFFITTSASEGSPVSIQEALAYGIPIVGTDVGEVPYLLEGNGLLIAEDPDTHDITEAIRNMCSMNEKDILSLRNKAYKKWENKYNVISNASRFAKLLLEIN